MTQPEIVKLSMREKLHLTESLWDAICHEPTGEPGMPAWHEAVLTERLARLDAGHAGSGPRPAHGSFFCSAAWRRKARVLSVQSQT